MKFKNSLSAAAIAGTLVFGGLGLGTGVANADDGHGWGPWVPWHPGEIVDNWVPWYGGPWHGDHWDDWGEHWGGDD